jgi:hypothetical protein
MFKIGDKVSFGVRHSNGVKRGGIVRLSGTILDTVSDLLVVKANGRLYNLRELKGGWVVETERDDPKGRLYLEMIYEEELETV